MNSLEDRALTSFLSQLRSISYAIDNPTEWFDKDLQVVSKSTTKPSSQASIWTVVVKLFQFVQANQCYLEKDLILRKRVVYEIWMKLDRRTEFKYALLLDEYLQKSYPLVPLMEVTRELSWPEELGSINVLPAKQEEITQTVTMIFDCIFRFGYKIHSQKRATLELSKDSTMQSISLPAGLWFERPNKPLTSLFLFTKIIVGSGGQRKVKKGYNLLQGGFTVRKRIQTENELRIAKLFAGRSYRGIAQVRAVRPYGEGKNQIIEDLYDGTIFSILTGYIATKVSLQVMGDLLHGLKILHAQGDFHGDINQANVLVRKQFEAALTDFGSASDKTQMAATFPYFCPQKADYLIREFPVDPADRAPLAIDHYKSDIWSLGLIFAGLLKGVCSVTIAGVIEPTYENVPDLQFLERIFFCGENQMALLDFSRMTQQTIDEEIASYVDSCGEDTARKELWNMVGKMLQLEEAYRPSAKELWEMYSALPDYSLAAKQQRAASAATLPSTDS